MVARPLLVALASTLAACGSVSDDTPTVTYASDVTPVTDAAEAQPGVFIPPFVDCREPVGDDTTDAEDGKVCSNVAISGCTEQGLFFPDYASCDVVKTQRPYWPAPPATVSVEDDPRLTDTAYLAELEWAAEQAGASGCACCHDSRAGKPSQWDSSSGPLWLDSLSDSGLALFSGLADSSVLGAYPAAQNHGFDRSVVGLPTTDNARMQAIMFAELERRGISQQDAAALPPFGGPIYANYKAEPRACTPDEGIDGGGVLRWKGDARYVYVLKERSENPGVPPNLDLPEGTLWRLDVLASAPAIQGGLRYGSTPPGTFQRVPADAPAPNLQFGHRYHFVIVESVGVTAINCTFELRR
jgi:hypothetical protein